MGNDVHRLRRRAWRRCSRRLEGPVQRVPARRDPARDAQRRIEAHVEAELGMHPTRVYEPDAPPPQVSVLIVAPGPRREQWTLVTTGLSRVPLRARGSCHPAGKRAELVLCLPARWRLFASERGPQRGCWPALLLMTIARGLVERGQHPEWGETYEHGERFPGLPFTGAVFMPPLHEGFWQLRPRGGPTVELLGVWPLHPAELALKRKHGLCALLDAFDAAGVSEVFEPARRCARVAG